MFGFMRRLSKMLIGAPFAAVEASLTAAPAIEVDESGPPRRSFGGYTTLFEAPKLGMQD